MKNSALLLTFCLVVLQATGCIEKPKAADKSGATATEEALPNDAVTRTVINPNDSLYGYYLAIVPKGKIDGVLVLFQGFGGTADAVLAESKLGTEGYNNNVLTIIYAAGNKLYADTVVRNNVTAMLNNVIAKYKVPTDKFVLGGFSAGGMIALRYTELCNQFPTKYPIQPKGVFMVDSPIDIFTIWDQMEEFARDRHSAPAAEEADRALQSMRNDYGAPREHIPVYAELTAFSMNKAYSENEKYLQNTPVRTYHDVDINWRLQNRNQTARHANFTVSSELINRLMLMGNKKAEFIQTYQNGYRSNGQRHPHSWSIVDEKECIKWIKGLL